MLDGLNLKHVLFLDIETVPQHSAYSELDELSRKLWDKKSGYFKTEGQTNEEIYKRAGIYAEFGKIICISVGILHKESGDWGCRIKSYYGDNEKELLMEFATMLENIEAKRPVVLCAHNGKEFDFPYLSRRMIINKIKLPLALDNSGKKPWEIHHIDTLDLWKFGDYKHYTSLELLANIMGIESPKDDIDGSMVGDVYYTEGNIKRIKRYCEADVLSVIRLLLRYVMSDIELNTTNIKCIDK